LLIRPRVERLERRASPLDRIAPRHPRAGWPGKRRPSQPPPLHHGPELVRGRGRPLRVTFGDVPDDRELDRRPAAFDQV